MKIFELPKEVPAPSVDYSEYDRVKVLADEEKHMADLKTYLQKMGYSGQHTGGIYREPVADGYALYMVAHGGNTLSLIHLPYGDAYSSRNVQFLPKSEIIRRLEADKKMALLFAKKS